MDCKCSKLESLKLERRIAYDKYQIEKLNYADTLKKLEEIQLRMVVAARVHERVSEKYFAAASV